MNAEEFEKEFLSMPENEQMEIMRKIIPVFCRIMAGDTKKVREMFSSDGRVRRPHGKHDVDDGPQRRRLLRVINVGGQSAGGRSDRPPLRAGGRLERGAVEG
jgi:hypothetical protein